MRLNIRWFCVMLLMGLSASGSASPAPVRLNDAYGHIVELLGDPGVRATVLLFVTNECPITNAYAPEIRRLAKEFGPRHVAFYLVYADPSLRAAAVRRHVHEYRLSCPALLDPKQRLVHLTHADITPEAVVLSSAGKRLYRGRIDDRYIDFGKARFAATTHDLRDAIESAVSGKAVRHPETRAIGCPIPSPL